MKKRVCAYARVSTNSRSQEHSLEFQKNYWNETLGNNPDYEYVGLYADQGISGKFSKRRPQFMQMVNAVESGKIDLVFCKSVQRFSRNTEDLLTYVREFREYGVAVIFEKENINTLTIDSDLYLTIAAAVAEDDLSRYSQNVVWSIEDKFKKGEPITNGRLYGYHMSKTQKFVVNEEEAKVVREIFNLYLQGYSYEGIAETLNEDEIPAPMGGIWRNGVIRNITMNEKYVGDCLLQKEVTINGVKKVNNGIKNQYYVENHHDPIISREIWDATLELRNKRTNVKNLGRVQKVYPFTSLIVCGCCGGNYQHKVSKSLYTKSFDVWSCKEPKSKCKSIRVSDEELKDKFVEAYNEFITNRYKGVEEQDIQDNIDKLEDECLELTRLNANGWISNANFKEEYGRLKVEIETLTNELNKMKLRKLSDKDFKPIDVFMEDKVEKFLKGIVITGIDIDFEFYNGVIIKKQIERTRIYGGRK